MQEKEADLDRHNEDVARLSARHQSAHRMLSDAKQVLASRAEQSDAAAESVTKAKDGLAEA